MSGKLKEQRSNRFIPLNNLHPILKDLYSSSSHSSEFDITSGYLNNELGTEEAIGFEEEELQQVDYVEGRHFPRYYNKRRRKNLNVTANKLVEEVIRLAVERLNTDAANSEVEEYFDAEESTGQDAPGNPQVNFNLRPSVEVVSISSQTDLIVDPNEDLEVIDADDNHSSSNEESSQQGGTGDTIRNEKYCRVTTQCERCEVYMLNCYKFQCKCENLTIYSETLEKKVEEYVNLLNNYNTRLMTSRLLIKQSNGKQNELMMRCDELQEKIRLHQALKEIEHRKKKEMKKKYYINKFNKDFYELKHKVSIGESELEVVKDIVDDDKMKDIFDKYKQIDGIDWERLSPEELAAALEDLEYLEITGIKSPKVESSALIGGKLSEPSESAIYEALNVYENLLYGVLSRDEMNETFEKYKSLDSIDWSNLSPDRLRMTLKDLRDLELTERIRIFSGSESEQEIYSEDYQEVDEGIISKDESIGEKTRADSFEQGRSVKLIADGSKALGTEKTDSGVSMAIKERKLPSDYKDAIVEEKNKSDTELPKSTAETRDTDVLKKRGLVDEGKLSEIKSEEHGKDWELHGAGKSDKLSAKSGRIPAEGIVMTDVSKDDGAVKDDEQRDREKLGEADLYTKREDVEKPPFDRTKKEIMKTEESKEPEKTTLKESERARGEELEELKMIKKLEEDDKHVPPIKTDVSKKVDDGSVGQVVPESKPTLEGFAEKDDLKISGRGLQSGKDTAEEIYKRTSDTDFKDSVRGKDENIVSPISERREEQMRTKDGKSEMLDGDSRDGVTERRLEEITSGKMEENKDDLYPTSEKQTIEKGEILIDSQEKDKAAVRKDDTVSEEDKKKGSPPVTESITRKEASNLEEDKKKEITPATQQIMKKGARDYMDEKDGKLVPPIKTDKVDDRVTPDQYGREEDLATSKSKQAVGKDDELPKKIDDRIDDRVAPDQYGREEDLATSKSKQIVGKDDQIPKRIDDRTDDRVTPDQYGREEDLATSKSKQVVGKDDQLPKRIDDKVRPDPYGREEDLATSKSKQIVGKDDQIPKRIDDRIDDRVTPDQYGREEDLSTSKSKQIVGKDDQIPKRIDDRIDDRVTPDQYGREEDLATSKSKPVVGKDDQLPKRINDKVTPDQYGREEDLATSKSKQVVGSDSDTHPSKVPRGVADTSGEKESLKRDGGETPVEKDQTPSKTDGIIDKTASDLNDKVKPADVTSSEQKQIPKEEDMLSKGKIDESLAKDMAKPDSIKSKEIGEPKTDLAQKDTAKDMAKPDSIKSGESKAGTVKKESGIDDNVRSGKANDLLDSKPKEAQKAMEYETGDLSDKKTPIERKLGKEAEVTTPGIVGIGKSPSKEKRSDDVLDGKASDLTGKEGVKPSRELEVDDSLAEKTALKKQTELTSQKIKDDRKSVEDRAPDELTEMKLRKEPTVEKEKQLDKTVKGDKEYPPDVKKSVPDKEQELSTTQKQKETDKLRKDEELMPGESSMRTEPGEEQVLTTQREKGVEKSGKDGKADELVDKKPLIGAESGMKEEVTQQKPFKKDEKPHIDVMDTTMQDKLDNKGKTEAMKDLKEDFSKKVEMSDSKGNVLDGSQSVEKLKTPTDKSQDEKNAFDGTSPDKIIEQKEQDKKDVQKEMPKIEGLTKTKDTPSKRAENLYKESFAQPADFMEAKQKADDLISNISEKLTGEKQIHPKKSIDKSQLKQEKQGDVSVKQEERGGQAIDEAAKKGVEDLKKGKEQTKEAYAKEKVETSEIDKRDSPVIGAKKQQRDPEGDTATVSKVNQDKQEEGDPIKKKPIDEKVKDGEIKSIPALTKEDIIKDESNRLPQEKEIKEKGETPYLEKVSSTSKAKGKLDERQKDSENIKRGQLDDSALKDGTKDAEGVDRGAMREMNIVSKDKLVETKKYPKNLLQETDEVDKDGLTKKFGKNVEDEKQFPSQIPKTNEIPIKGRVSPLKSEPQDLKNKDNIIPSTKNIQDEQTGVEKSKTFPGQKSNIETSNKMLTDKEPETFTLSGREEGKPEKFEKKRIGDVSPEKSQNLKDEPKRLDDTQRAVEQSKLSPKFTREQLAGENKNVDNPLERKPSTVVDKISVFNAPTDGEKIDSEKQQGMGLIEDKASAKTIPKLSSSQMNTKKSTTEGEKLKPQDKTLPGSVEQGNLNKVKTEVGDRLPTQDELIASKGSPSDINQEYEKATKPQKESKISERIKSIESQLPPSHPSKPSKVPAKSTDKLTQDQSDDRLKDKLSASGKDGKLTKKDSKDFDRVKQSEDNLRSKRSPDEMKTGQERNKQLDGIQPKKEEGRDRKLEQSKAKSKSIDKERRKIKSSDSEGSLSQSSQSQGGGMRHDDGIQERNGSRNLRETGKLDKLTSSRVSKEKKHADKLPTHLTKKEQEKAGKPSEKPDEYSASRNIQSKNQVPADKAVRKSASQTNAKGDQTLSRKSKIDEKQLQGKVIRGDNKSKEKEEPDYSKAEASQIREKDKAMGQSKIKTQVKKDEKVDPKLRKSASQKVDPKEIAASRKINGTGKKGTVTVDSQDVKHSRSLPPQYTSDSETNNVEKPDTWKIKPTLLEKMKKYGIQVLTLDELDRLHDEVLVAMRAHHGLTDSETDETDIQKELQQLSPEDLGNLHSELSDLAENKKSRNKPLQSMSKIKILTQLAGGKSPPEHDTSGLTAPKRKPAEIPTDITKRVLRPDTLKIGSPTDDATSRMMEPNRLGIGVPSSSLAFQKRLGAPPGKDQLSPTYRPQNDDANSRMMEPNRLGIGVPSSSLASQKRLGAPPGKDQLSPTYRPQNMNEPRTNDPRMEVAESLRRRNDDFVQGRRPSKVQDRRTSQMRGSIIEKLQQYINDQTLAGKPLKKKPSHECHCTPQDKNIVKKCFCSH